MSDNLDRIDIAVRCTDCLGVPRVPEAGRVVEENGRRVQIMHNGVKVDTESHYGMFNTRVIERLLGHHEPQGEWVFHHVLKNVPDGGTMIELGSFWAYYSMWFQKAVQNAKSVMVEPLAFGLDCGQDNFKLNGMQGAFVQASVGERSIEQIDFESWDGSRHQVPQVCVDDLMADQGIDHLNVLHADIQGAELDMLRGADRALSAHKIDYLFLATHSEFLHRRCQRQLKARGYRVIASHTLAESYSVDGLIVAASPHCEEPPEVIISRKRPTLRERYRLVKGCVLDHGRPSVETAPEKKAA